MNQELLDASRGVEMVLSGFCLIVGTVRTILVWSKFSRGQKFVFVSMWMLLITAMWDTWALIRGNEEFSWRVVPFMIGLFCCFAYLMEPSRSWKRRLGREPFDPKEHGEL